ncbi:hypothetical protein RHS01_11205 [Rhizoctonia solani]|uniref:Retrotransposable element Tf2 155 kDa protein type 1 n=1 Tax=Rhizoctonia solani TaxID=456999 RepID=A0A8H7LZ63_9AGAM|nr:hypothetical protein RHS01_11205 [Rhizoctonia solani]
MAPGPTCGLGQWPFTYNSFPSLPHWGHTGNPWHDLVNSRSPLIDWQQGLVTFPEQVQIASEEEADPNPLADLPEQYHEFARVFGEEEFKVLPPHREYDISIDLTLDAKLTPGPIYGMTDAESKALKQHIDEELATGKIRPSTSSAGAPLDLRWGYNNVRIKEGDEWKTAFRTKYGLFEYLVMPFGLTNAPAAFQHFMNDLFRDLIDVTVVIYLDDILIFSKNPEEHPSHVREVLSRLMRNQLFCKLSKCHFHVTTVDYLGIVISPAGFSMDQKKIEAVTSWPTPKTANYDTHDKELLAIIKALEEWRIFLEATDRPIQVFTDHRNLEYWMQARTFNRRHARWRIFLSNFNFEIHYRPGKQSGKPDALSRRLDYMDRPQEPEIMLPAEVFANTSEEEVEIVTEIRTKLQEDPHWSQSSRSSQRMQITHPHPLEKHIGITIGKKTYSGTGYHDSPLAGHPGQQQTLELLSRNYWWPGMKSSAKEWVECCPTCQANRCAHAPVIALKPLEVPPYPFHTISYDFITGFPKSNGHNAILVVIDSFSKFGHFIPTTKKVTSKGLAELFISHVWKLHGLPVRTISDRGTTFTGKFLRALYQRLDHSDWASWLPLAEYAYNNAKHLRTGKTPFELVYGRNPVMNPSNVPANVPEANHVANTLAREWREAESALRMTKEKMAGTKGVIPEYSIGEKVWLDAKNVEIRSNSNKLDPRRLGPFKISEKISSHAYRLELPETMKIHNVFYVGLLSKVHESPSQPLPERPPPETIEGEEEYEVEQIIDSKQQKGKWFYLIKWKGYGPEDNSWEPEELLEHSQEEIKRFNQARLRKACDAAKSL